MGVRDYLKERKRIRSRKQAADAQIKEKARVAYLKAKEQEQIKLSQSKARIERRIEEQRYARGKESKGFFGGPIGLAGASYQQKASTTNKKSKSRRKRRSKKKRTAKVSTSFSRSDEARRYFI